MFSWLKFWKLDADIRARTEACWDLLANTGTVSVWPFGKKLDVEVLVIPAITPAGKIKTPRFVFPGGGTGLFLCIEQAIYSDRETIFVSPLGYGKSSDIPDEISQNPLLSAVVNLHVLRALEKKGVILSGHSNANPIQGETVFRAPEFGIEIERVEMTNPLGLRKISRVWAGMAFTISGGLTRLASLFVEHPVDLLQGSYQVPKRSLKIGYELDKTCVARLPEIFRRISEERIKIPPILVILSSWNWGSLHWPWRPSDEKILRQHIPDHLLKIVKIPGLHNVTLGKDSKILADVLEKSTIVLSLALIFLPQLPVYASWLARALA